MHSTRQSWISEPSLCIARAFPPQCGKPDEQGNILIPKLSYPSAEQLSYDGVYLLNCATVMYLLICPDVSAELLQSLFGVPQLGLFNVPVDAA